MSSTEGNALAIEETKEELGGIERRVARPRTEPELRALFARLGKAQQHGILIGRGSSMDWCAPTLWCDPPSTDETLWISMESLIAPGSTGIVEYVPGDGTLTAQGGAPIETLRAAVLEGGHRITPAGPSRGATLGGMLASGASSLDRCAFGPTRHHVLGMRIQDATDRGPTKTGGRLVKNATGFDLHRLHVGGRGTLGAILEASLRLVPVPEAEVLVVSRPYSSAAEATAAALQIRSKRGIQPRALFVVHGKLHVVLAGRERQMETEHKRLLADLDVESEVRGLEVEPLALEAARRRSVITIGTAPSQVEDIARQLESNGIGPLYVEPDAALVELDQEALGHAPGEFLQGLDPRLVHVTLHRPIPKLRALQNAIQEVATPAPALRQWTERLRSSFDPQGVLSSPDFPLPTDTSR